MAWESINHGGRPKWEQCFHVQTSWETVTVWVFTEREQRMELLVGCQLVDRMQSDVSG